MCGFHYIKFNDNHGQINNLTPAAIYENTFPQKLTT